MTQLCSEGFCVLESVLRINFYPHRMAKFKWYRWNSNLDDAKRIGRTQTYIIKENITDVRKMVKEPQIKETLSFNSMSIRSILKCHQRVTKYWCLWVSNRLAKNQKIQRVKYCRETLNMFDKRQSSYLITS